FRLQPAVSSYAVKPELQLRRLKPELQLRRLDSNGYVASDAGWCAGIGATSLDLNSRSVAGSWAWIISRLPSRWLPTPQIANGVIGCCSESRRFVAIAAGRSSPRERLGTIVLH